MKTAVSILLITTYLLVSLVATRSILRSGQGKLQQIQILITWLFPIFGAMIFILFNRRQKPLGSHLDKTPSWTRLIQYQENGHAG